MWKDNFRCKLCGEEWVEHIEDWYGRMFRTPDVRDFEIRATRLSVATNMHQCGDGSLGVTEYIGSTMDGLYEDEEEQKE